MQAELEAAKALAREAGLRILSFSAQDLAVHEKQDESPVTRADREANDIMVKGLKDRFPDDAILAEESEDDKSRLKSERVWIVDPLDGTKEFLKENGEYTVNIALAVNGEPVLGAIYLPTRNTLYYASKEGAFKDGQRIKVSEKTDSTDMIVSRSRSHSSEQEQDYIDRVGFKETIPAGSSMKGCLVAEAKTDAYIRMGPVMEWDMAAMQAIIQAAGGVMTDLEGNTIAYNNEEVMLYGFLASNNKAHAHLLEALNG